MPELDLVTGIIAFGVGVLAAGAAGAAGGVYVAGGDIDATLAAMMGSLYGAMAGAIGIGIALGALGAIG